jgi:hypothetical protein
MVIAEEDRLLDILWRTATAWAIRRLLAVSVDRVTEENVIEMLMSSDDCFSNRMRDYGGYCLPGEVPEDAQLRKMARKMIVDLLPSRRDGTTEKSVQP